jgi:CBS domain-containing protein
MTAKPKTIAVTALAAEAVALMNNSAPRVTSLFVVDGEPGALRPVGFLTIHDCLRAGVQ